MIRRFGTRLKRLLGSSRKSMMKLDHRNVSANALRVRAAACVAMQA